MGELQTDESRKPGRSFFRIDVKTVMLPRRDVIHCHLVGQNNLGRLDGSRTTSSGTCGPGIPPTAARPPAS